MPRILTGITPSGTLHIGNYFGAMRPAIELQAGGDAYYFIADYHSMTSLFDPAERRQNTLDVALDFLACGLDPKKAVFFFDPSQFFDLQNIEDKFRMNVFQPKGRDEVCPPGNDLAATSIFLKKDQSVFDG